jgi:hypothetical protein
MKKIIGILLMPFLFSGCSNSQEVGTYNGYELPPYSVISKEEVKESDFEIREYKPQLVAEVTVDGERDEAIGKGFRILAGYIFGDNENKIEVAMTTPVTQSPTSEKIAMTTPVTQDKVDDSWVVRFGMPKEYTMETLPKAKNNKISFTITKPSKKVAVVFSGFTGDEKLAAQTKLLEDFITAKKLTKISEPTIAFYNDPFTFPWNRRNEILIEVK